MQAADLFQCTLLAIRDLPGYRIDGQGETIRLEAGQTYWLEIASSSPADTEVEWRYDNGMEVYLDHLDRNIFKIKLTGSPGQLATFFLSNQRSFKAVLSPPAP